MWFAVAPFSYELCPLSDKCVKFATPSSISWTNNRRAALLLRFSVSVEGHDTVYSTDGLSCLQGPIKEETPRSMTIVLLKEICVVGQNQTGRPRVSRHSPSTTVGVPQSSKYEK